MLTKGSAGKRAFCVPDGFAGRDLCVPNPGDCGGHVESHRRRVDIYSPDFDERACISPDGENGMKKWTGFAACVALACLVCGAARMSARPPDERGFDGKFFQEMRWRMIGPFRGGRVLGVTGVRGEPDVYYFGAVGGGVWKTNDGGAHLEPHF